MTKLTTELTLDWNTVVIEGLYLSDYPDLCDAYIDRMYYTDGSKLFDDEIKEVEKVYPDKIHELAKESCF